MNKTSFIARIFIFLSTLAFFALRPMFLGYKFTGYALVLLAFCALMTFVSTSRLKDKYDKLNAGKTAKLVLLTYVPVFILEMLSLQAEVALGNMVILGCTVICCLILFSLKNASSLFLGNLKYLFLLIIASTIITSIFYFSSDQLKMETWKYLEVEVRSRKDVGNVVNVYFPFTPLYTFFTLESFKLPRFNLFFMEAGMVPGFFASMSFLFFQRKTFSNITCIILFTAGSLLTFSTSFVPSFALPFFVYLLLNGRLSLTKIIVSISIMAAGYYAFLKIPFFGFEDKMLTHGTSFEDRMTWYSLSFENLLRYVRIISGAVLIYRLGLLKENRILFYSFMSSIFFIGVVNFVLYSPLFVLFCFLDLKIEKKKNKKLKTLRDDDYSRQAGLRQWQPA
ncbi:hypothetical protein GCM10007423_64390 [Dyadobacter endophyticus]|uniref:Polymerase n=1 Tax=Dyadobacter endophyticus TaxID=1749036 RepID=A0ABQ1ZE76_9BACT|nr:hypothetical protein [Dyadobacter endophyticus]GGH56130.1 hypothetical protein GCM10007423_64390 [Dyadobacter endophyticus]